MPPEQRLSLLIKGGLNPDKDLENLKLIFKVRPPCVWQVLLHQHACIALGLEKNASTAANAWTEKMLPNIY